jgi:hypothetical protein
VRSTYTLQYTSVALYCTTYCTGLLLLVNHPYQICTHNYIAMAETPDRNNQNINNPQPQTLLTEEADEPQPDPSNGSGSGSREATELARLSRNYTRASSYRRSSTASRKPPSLLERYTWPIMSFWKHQVSVTVPHNSCRDHLGTSSTSTYPLYIASTVAFSHREPDLAVRTGKPSRAVQHLIWYFSKSFDSFARQVNRALPRRI